MSVKQRIKLEANYWKALRDIYRVLFEMVKRRPAMLVRTTPEESKKLQKALDSIRKRYGLSKPESNRVLQDAKKQLARDK